MSPWLALLLLACPPPAAPATVPPSSEQSEETEVEVTWPETLRATGLYAEGEALGVGVIPFEVAWELWSDGATKERYLWLPEGAVIDTADPDRWAFPAGTRAWKTFHRGDVRIETRYLERLPDGTWSRVAYLWRRDGSDADPVPEGVVDAWATDHDVPDTLGCRQCHIADGLLGVSAIQLGPDSPAPLLEALAEAGHLSAPLAAGEAVVPGEGDVREALGYLHANCGNCHNDHAPWAQGQDLRLRVPVGAPAPEATPTYVTGIDAPTRHAFGTSVSIAPGEPEASQIYERMGLRNALQMPPLGTKHVDTEALAVIYDWISGLPPAE